MVRQLRALERATAAAIQALGPLEQRVNTLHQRIVEPLSRRRDPSVTNSRADSGFSNSRGVRRVFADFIALLASDVSSSASFRRRLSLDTYSRAGRGFGNLRGAIDGESPAGDLAEQSTLTPTDSQLLQLAKLVIGVARNPP
ncbi:Purple acid phosphatase 23-like [Phytophthora palmivora]|uniref:Purple acid phosphatase 23-like n=1 Tax=Phytophthora palmivora TaxID=4796 RepID=A0A2P4XU57_9STRA|nr:Purple acid phosphatase 23-like [Phytophthora palmivora]